jgi:hypothetical protein
VDTDPVADGPRFQFLTGEGRLRRTRPCNSGLGHHVAAVGFMLSILLSCQPASTCSAAFSEIKANIHLSIRMYCCISPLAGYFSSRLFKVKISRVQTQWWMVHISIPSALYEIRKETPSVRFGPGS